MGVIDTLSAGFSRVTKKPWLIIVPVLLDLLIALGPRLSIEGLTRSLLPLIPDGAALGAPYEETLPAFRAWVTELGQGSNVLTMLSMRALGLPSVTAALGTEALARASIVEVQSWARVVLFSVALFVAGLFAGAITLSFAAQEAREDEPDVGYVLRVAGRAWLRLTRLALMLIGAITVLATGLTILITLVGWLSPALATLVLNLFAFGILGVSVYAGLVLFFMPQAIVLDDIGLVQSFWNSLNIAYRNVIPTVMLVVLTNIIRTGFMYVWQALSVNTAGTLVSILGNAYIGLGLVMASLLFYRDRFVAWQDAMLLARASKGKQ